MESGQKVAVSSDPIALCEIVGSKKVNQNQGKRTAGVDGEIWSSPKAKMKAALDLTDKKYKAKPLKRVFIEKPGKRRSVL